MAASVNLDHDSGGTSWLDEEVLCGFFTLVLPVQYYIIYTLKNYKIVVQAPNRVAKKMGTYLAI